AYRRVPVLIGTSYIEALLLQHRGERRHRGPAHSDQVHTHHHSTADSSMISRGCTSAITRQVTPNGSVTAGPIVWPDGNPNNTGPGKSLNKFRITERAVGVPDGSSQRGSWLMTTALAFARRPVCCSCVTMRSSRYGRSPTSSRNSTYPGGGVKA